MGAWGNKLYENDVTLDVKDAFEKYYRVEKDILKITNKLLEDFEDVINYPQEAKLFWFALADVQGKTGDGGRQDRGRWPVLTYPWEAEANELGGSTCFQPWKPKLPQGEYTSYWSLIPLFFE